MTGDNRIDRGLRPGSARYFALRALGLAVAIGMVGCEPRKAPSPPAAETQPAVTSDTVAPPAQAPEEHPSPGAAAAPSEDRTPSVREPDAASPEALATQPANEGKTGPEKRKRAAAVLPSSPTRPGAPAKPSAQEGAAAKSAADTTQPSPKPDDAETAVEKLEQSPSTPTSPVQSQATEDGGRKPPPPPTFSHDPCERPDENEVAVIDSTRQMLEEQSCSAALWVDGLFGKDRNADAARRTRGFVELSGVYSQFGGFNSRTRFRVEYDFPNMKKSLSAFVGRENDEDFVRGRTENAELRNTFPTLGTDNKWLAGLGYSLPGTKNLQTSVRVGVRGLTPPTGFVQGRMRYTIFSTDNDVAYTRTTPFWNTRDGFGTTQSIDYSRVLTHRHLLRWYTVGTISERTEGLNWRESLILYHNLQRKRGLAYEAFIRGETDEPEPLYEYGGRVLLRHPYLQQRLFLEWSAGYSFPRTDPTVPRDGSYNAGLSVEMPFGSVDDDLSY